MIDYFALALTHGLLLAMVLRLMVRPDLDREEPLAPDQESGSEPAPEVSERGRRKARRNLPVTERGDA